MRILQQQQQQKQKIMKNGPFVASLLSAHVNPANCL